MSFVLFFRWAMLNSVLYIFGTVAIHSLSISFSTFTLIYFGSIVETYAAVHSLNAVRKRTTTHTIFNLIRVVAILVMLSFLVLFTILMIPTVYNVYYAFQNLNLDFLSTTGVSTFYQVLLLCIDVAIIFGLGTMAYKLYTKGVHGGSSK